MDATASARFDADVEAVRTGTILAHDQRAYERWKSRRGTRTGRGLTGDALEAAVRRVAQQFPDNVKRGA